MIHSCTVAGCSNTRRLCLTYLISFNYGPEYAYSKIIKSLNEVKTQQNKIITTINSQNEKLNELNKKFNDLLNTVLP